MDRPGIDPKEAIQIAIAEKQREIAKLETEVEALQALKNSPSALVTLVKALQGGAGGLTDEVGPNMLKRMVQQLFVEHAGASMRVSTIVELLVKTRRVPVRERDVDKILCNDSDFETVGRGWWRFIGPQVLQ